MHSPAAPDDLLAQLKGPIQSRLVASSLSLRADHFELDESTLVFTSESTRGPMDIPVGDAHVVPT